MIIEIDNNEPNIFAQSNRCKSGRHYGTIKDWQSAQGAKSTSNSAQSGWRIQTECARCYREIRFKSNSPALFPILWSSVPSFHSSFSHLASLFWVRGWSGAAAAAGRAHRPYHTVAAEFSSRPPAERAAQIHRWRQRRHDSRAHTRRRREKWFSVSRSVKSRW